MTLDNIYTLIDKFDSSGAAKMELMMEDVTLKLEKTSTVIESNNNQMLATAIANRDTQYNLATSSGMMLNNSTSPNNSTTSANNNNKYINAPLVGVFYEASSPESKPFVKVGDRVKEGDTVCLIEAMKMMSEVTSTVTGTIKEILVKNGDTVEYNTPLYTIQE